MEVQMLARVADFHAVNLLDSLHFSVRLPETAASRTASRNFFRICGTLSSRLLQASTLPTNVSMCSAIRTCSAGGGNGIRSDSISPFLKEGTVVARESGEKSWVRRNQKMYLSDSSLIALTAI